MFLTPLIDFFLPRLCFACDNKLNPREEYVCSVCLLKFKTADNKTLHNEYIRKFNSRGLITEFRSVYVFEKGKEFQHLIHSLKYNRKFKAGVFLGKRAGEHLSDVISAWDIDVIIPVPLHKLKKLERGYNQSYYIARGMSSILKIPVNDGIIRREKNTLSQTNMNLREREENIKNAFKVKNSSVIRGKNLLLIDDVITTGSTINECARVLKAEGAHKIYAVSPAIADLGNSFNNGNFADNQPEFHLTTK